MSHRNNKKSKKRSKRFKHNRKTQKRSKKPKDRKPVKRYKKPLHKLVSKSSSSKRKRKVLPQQGGFFIPFMPAIDKMVYTPGVSEKRTAYML